MKNFIPPLGMAFIFIISQLIAIFVAPSFNEAGFAAFEEPDNPTNIAYVFFIIILFTILILLISKYKKNFVKYIILFSFFLASLSIFDAFFYFIYPSLSAVFALIISILMIILLFIHPEWYVIDVFSVFLAGGITAIFAISFSVELIFIFLIVLACYDALSVYKTRHMIKLAETITAENLPLLVIFPKKSSYSYLKSKFGGERDAIYMGLGDLIMPGMLITAAYLLMGYSGFLITLIGALCGYIVLMKLITKGPQPGLPYLNGGAIFAYLISYFLL